MVKGRGYGVGGLGEAITLRLCFQLTWKWLIHKVEKKSSLPVYDLFSWHWRCGWYRSDIEMEVELLLLGEAAGCCPSLHGGSDIGSSFSVLALSGVRCIFF